MSYQTYSLTRVIDGDGSEFATSFTTSDDDAINCAHMLAAGFNTMSRNCMGDFVLAVVDTEDGRVFYDGKVETIKRAAPWFSEQTITFNPTAGDADTILTLFGNGETPTFTAAGKFSFAENATDDEVMSKAADDLAKAAAGKIARSVLEDAYAELQAVKSVVEEVGVETIPLSSGVREMQYMIEGARARREAANTAARAELIEYVKGAYLKKQRLTVDAVRFDLEDQFRGMLDVLAKFLVVIGEADASEGHAVARRLCGIDDE